MKRWILFGGMILSLSSALLTGCGPGGGSSDAGGDAMDAQGPADASDTETGAEAAVGPDAQAPTMPVMATTRKGMVIGRSEGSYNEFLGIPYAAPPTGMRRWRAPAEPDAWTTPLQAIERPVACPQGPDQLTMQPVPYSEDCLRLNVWAPARRMGMRPVMVFVHGGGFTSGSGAALLYEGRRLAAQRDVVVVTFNYRLGQFGFLAHSALTAEDTEHHSSGNYGMLDQVAVLQWVRDNIAAFGGDPGNVTLFGESAGGISVCMHTVSPLSAGLFHRAIVQSGPCTFTRTPLHDNLSSPYQSAESKGFRFASALGCQGSTDIAACLRSKNTDMVLATVPTPFELEVRPARFQPNIDGYFLREDPLVSLREGRMHQVPVIVGTNRDEGTAFATLLNVTTAAQYRSAVEAMLPDNVDAVLRLYPVASYPSPRNAFEAFLADALFVCPARMHARFLAARNRPVFMYHFTKENQAGRLLALGVFHGAELPYVFGNFRSPFTMGTGDQAAAELTMSYWTRFAETGNPNGGTAPMWMPYSMTSDNHQQIADTAMPGTGLHRDKCDALTPMIEGV